MINNEETCDRNVLYIYTDCCSPQGRQIEKSEISLSIVKKSTFVHHCKPVAIRSQDTRILATILNEMTSKWQITWYFAKANWKIDYQNFFKPIEACGTMHLLSTWSRVQKSCFGFPQLPRSLFRGTRVVKHRNHAGGLQFCIRLRRIGLTCEE